MIVVYVKYSFWLFFIADEDENPIETEPPLNHQFLTSTPKSSKEDGRRTEKGWGFIRGLMDIFRLVLHHHLSISDLITSTSLSK